MSGLGFGNPYRKYYVDHPTSINHQEQYLIPLDNQYSILNKSRNPYDALDQFSSDIYHKSQPKNASYLQNLKKESLDLELKSWQQRQQERENDIRLARSEVRELEGLARLKELEQELSALSINQKSSHPAVIPFPMFMPIFPPPRNNCCCQCQCRCQQGYSHIKKSRPVITENFAVETDPSPITNLPSVRSVKTIKQLTQQQIPSKKVAIPTSARLPLAKRKALLRKFRIYSIAIYFCIYFKWFSFQFSVNRYNNFKDKYLIDSGKVLTENYKQVYSEMLKIDIPQLIRNAALAVPSPLKPPSVKFDITTLLKSEAVAKYSNIKELTILSENYQILFTRCGQFLISLLQAVEEKILEWEWGEVGYGLGIGSLNQSFVIDNVFLPHQIYLMVFHDGKGYAQISPESQKVLTMTKFIIKLLLFNVCLQLDNNKQWFQMYAEELKDKEDTEELFILLQISSKILFIMCQNMYEVELQDHDPNYEDVQYKFQIEPCNPLVYSHSIKKRRELFKNEDIKESNLLIYGIEKLDQVNGIMIQPFFKQTEKRVKAKLSHVLESIHEKLKDYNRQKYKEIWQQTLSNQYLVLRGLKKIMKSSRYYPFVSNSVIASKSNISSKKTLTKKSFDRDSERSGTMNGKVSLENLLDRRYR